MDKNAENLILLLRGLAFDRVSAVTELNCPAILLLATKHGVANLLYPMLRMLPDTEQPNEEFMKGCKKLTFSAAARSVNQDSELAELAKRFSERAIGLLPLKGAALKKLYKKPEYRSMSDIDLLVPLSSRAEIHDIMLDLGFRAESYEKTDTDVYFSPIGLKYELHYDLTDEAQNRAQAEFLSHLFDYAVKQDNLLQLPAEEHYIYVLLHALKHFKNGGIGIRHLMDIWVCCHRQQMDGKRLQQYLKRFDLQQFAVAMQKLADVWFSGVEADELSQTLGDYILSGMLFGTETQRIENRMLQRKANPRTYWLRRIFPSYQVMCSYFPCVKKFPALLPFLWIFRLFRGLVKRDKLSKEYQAVHAASENGLREKELLFKRCGVSYAASEQNRQ